MSKKRQQQITTQKKAPHGEKMIEVKVRFWTNAIASKQGHVWPKEAWAGGVVRMEPNAAHGIVPGQPLPFHSLMDLPRAIEAVLIKHGVVLHLNRRMKKYVAP